MRLAYEQLNGRAGHEAGRALLARLFLEETGREMPAISCTLAGKPYFTENVLHFSISHTKNHVFCTLSGQNIGIDAEEMTRPVNLKILDTLYSPVEKARCLASPDPKAAALRLWVLKESYAKYTGRGLGDYLKRTDFDPGDPRIREIDGCFVAVFQEDDHAI